MTDRYVRLNVLTKGVDITKKDLTTIRDQASDLDKTRIELGLGLKGERTTSDQMDSIRDKFKSLGALTADLHVSLHDDKADEQLDSIELKMLRIGNMIAHPDVSVSGYAKASAELDVLKHKADKLRESASSGGGIFGKLLSRINPKNLPGMTDESGEVKGLLSNPYALGAIGGGLAALLPAIPSVLGLGVGGLVGAGGIGLSALGGTQSAANVASDKQIIAELKKNSKSQLNQSDLASMQKQLASDTKMSAVFTNFQATATNLLTPLVKIIEPFTKALTPMIAQLGRFEQAIGPQLTKMFMASLPFVKTFLGFLEQGSKTFIPAFTQTMNEMVKSGALRIMVQQGLIPFTKSLTTMLTIMGPDMRMSAQIFAGAMKVVSGVVVTLSIVMKGLTDIWRIAGGVIILLARLIKDAVTLNFGAMGKALGNFGDDVKGVWDGFRHNTMAALDYVFPQLKSFGHNTASVFDDIRHGVSNTWDLMWDNTIGRLHNGIHDAESLTDGFRRNVESGFDSLRHSVANTWDAMFRDIKNIAASGISGLRHVLTGLEGAFRTPVAFVVNDVWDKLAGIWNKITGIVHLSSLKLPVVHFAEGGVVPGSGKGDHVPAMLEPGERILSNAQVASAGGHGVLDMMFGRGTGGPFGYSGGGIIGGIGGFLKGIGKDLVGWASKPLSFITSHLFGSVTGMLGNIPGSAVGMTDVLKSLTTSIIADLGKEAKSGANAVMGGKYTGHYGAGVGQWKGDVLKALAMEHLPLSLASRVLYQMQTESGGNPNAINLTDSNAAAGDPSRGLLQTIMSTFRAFHWPGTSYDIYNPLANIAAAINYARHTYGPSLMSGGMGMGSGHGYANGGLITEPIIGTGLRSGMGYSFGENGFEYVSPMNHSRNANGGEVYNVYVSAAAFDTDATALKIQQSLRAYKKRKGNVPLGLS